jgi:hypothetical protein
MKKKKDTGKIFWSSIAIGFILLFVLILISSILSVGDRLESVLPAFHLDIVFYVVSGLLTYILVIRPVHIVLFSPAFSVETTLDEGRKHNRALYKRVAKRLLSSETLPEENRMMLESSMDQTDALREALAETFDKVVKKQMTDVVRKHAKTIMVSTAISQNGRLDAMIVVAVNLRMIKDLVVMCGYRPSFKNLAKLTINVFSTALIAEGLEDMNLGEVLPMSGVNTLGELPLVKGAISSVTQGISNALLTLRVGIVTRKYLFSDSGEMSKEKIRRDALLEAAKLTPLVVGEVLAMFPKRFFGLFRKNDKTESDE